MSEVAKRNETLALLQRMEVANALTPTHLDLSERPELGIDTFSAIARFVSQVHDGSKFWTGDLILQAEARWGEAGYQVSVATGRSERTLQNWVWVCSKVAPSRRRAGLSFTHHYLVAGLEPLDQRRWLERAEAEKWNSVQLRQAIQDERELAERSHASMHEEATEDCDVVLDGAVEAFREAVVTCYGPDATFEVVVRPIPGAELILGPGGGK
jgi:hypothetical protein